MFECKIELDGIYQKLSLENGLHLKEFAELIGKLSKCIETESVKFTVTGIKGDSYDPILHTDAIEGVNEFLRVHEVLKNTEFDELSEPYRDYALSLQRVCFRNGIFLRASAASVKQAPIEIKEIKGVVGDTDYSLITSITGKIVSIVGKNEENPYVTAETHRGDLIKIFVRGEQEKGLSKFYKDYFISFRLRIKRNLQNEFKSAVLLDYTVPEYSSFIEALEKVKHEFGDIFSNINDSAKLLREIRKYD